MSHRPARAPGFIRAPLDPLATHLELDELLHLLASLRAQLAQHVEQLHVLVAEGSLDGGLRFHAAGEEVGDLEVEGGEDLDQVVERDPVLALLHPRQVGLLDANLACQLGLGQVAFLAQPAQAYADRRNLGARGSGPTDHGLPSVPSL
jgi:hypothetical protein